MQFRLEKYVSANTFIDRAKWSCVLDESGYFEWDNWRIELEWGNRNAEIKVFRWENYSFDKKSLLYYLFNIDKNKKHELMFDFYFPCHISCFAILTFLLFFRSLNHCSIFICNIHSDDLISLLVILFIPLLLS